jgi:hypothetical protein
VYGSSNRSAPAFPERRQVKIDHGIVAGDGDGTFLIAQIGVADPFTSDWPTAEQRVFATS